MGEIGRLELFFKGFELDFLRNLLFVEHEGSRRRIDRLAVGRSSMTDRARVLRKPVFHGSVTSCAFQILLRHTVASCAGLLSSYRVECPLKGDAAALWRSQGGVTVGAFLQGMMVTAIAKLSPGLVGLVVVRDYFHPCRLRVLERDFHNVLLSSQETRNLHDLVGLKLFVLTMAASALDGPELLRRLSGTARRSALGLLGFHVGGQLHVAPYACRVDHFLQGTGILLITCFVTGTAGVF